jgi:hypothetical protein
MYNDITIDDAVPELAIAAQQRVLLRARGSRLVRALPAGTAGILNGRSRAGTSCTPVAGSGNRRRPTALVQEFEDLGISNGAFVRERSDVDQGHTVPKDRRDVLHHAHLEQIMNGQPVTQTGSNNEAVPAELPWLTLSDVTTRVRCGRKIIYRAVAAGKLRAAVINARGDLRFRPEWVDAWLDGLAPAEMIRTAPE